MVRNSQKFVPPTRRKEPTKTPECRRLYTDSAESIFSSTPELINPTRTDSTLSPGVNNQNQEEFVNGKVPFVRVQRRLLKRTQADPIHEGKRKAAKDQRMMSDPLPAVQSHLGNVGCTPNDCNSIFNFTQSPPPKRKSMTASERKKIYLDVLLTIYKMKNQLQSLRERRESLTEKRQRMKPQGIRGEE